MNMLCYAMLMTCCFGTLYFRESLQRKTVWLQMLVYLLLHFLVASELQATHGELVCFEVS